MEGLMGTTDQWDIPLYDPTGLFIIHIFPHLGHEDRSSVRDDPLVPDQTHSAPIKHRSSRFVFITAFPLLGDLSHTHY